MVICAAVLVQHRFDSVLVGKRETVLDHLWQFELCPRSSRDRHVEPDALDARRVLDQPQYRRPRWHHPAPGLFFGESVQEMDHRNPVLAHNGLDLLALTVGREGRVAVFVHAS